MKIEMVYPNFPFWRAEVSRLALYLGGIPFANTHPTREEFQQLKENGGFPFGQVPVLRVDDKVIAQTGAIARFCGKLSGLYPNDDPLQAAEVDQVIDAATDITNLFSASMREKDVARKMALREALAHGKLPIWLGYLERLLVQNGKTGFFVGQQLTIADLAIWRLVDWLTGGILDGVPQNVVDPFPLLKHHHAEIGNLAKVKEWMEKQYGK